MDEPARCSGCGAPLQAGAALEGLCPACLLARGLDSQTQSIQPSTCHKCGAELLPADAVCQGCGENVEQQPATQLADQRAPDDAAPVRLGEFTIVRTIGQGGMGTVYEALQESMHRRVALKVLNPGVLPSTTEAVRFDREAWIGGRLSHPQIVKVYGQGTAEGRRYIAMELVEGGSLHAELQALRQTQRRDPQPMSSWRSGHIRRMVSRFVGLADALYAVHRHGVVHRDIKPLNLLVASDKRLLLSDFGLARDDDASRLTRHGDFMGTIRYMSPEQLLAYRAPIDHRSDIWSFGVSLYEAVTLALPYSASSEEAYIGAVGTKDPVPARTRNRAVPRDLETILMKCLERDPVRRYATAADLRDDLTRYLEDRPVLARRPGPIVKAARFARRQRVPLAAAGLTALIALAVLVTTARHDQVTRNLEAVRTTLEQSIDQNVGPNALRTDWDTLLATMHEEVNANPMGEIALLARRVACHVTGIVPAFGLISNPPRLELRYIPHLDPGLEYRCMYEVQGSWDDGPWLPISYATDAYFVMGNHELEMFSDSDLAVGPHRLGLRASITVFDTREIGIRSHSGIGELPDTDVTELVAAPVHREMRALGVHPVNLFDAYPEGFPRAIPRSALTEGAEEWLLFDRLILLQGRIVGGTQNTSNDETDPARCFEFGVPDSDFTDEICQAQEDVELDGSVVGFILQGAIGPHDPVPIAAEASLEVVGGSEPILEFDLTLGKGLFFRSREGRPWLHFRLS